MVSVFSLVLMTNLLNVLLPSLFRGATDQSSDFCTPARSDNSLQRVLSPEYGQTERVVFTQWKGLV